MHHTCQTMTSASRAPLAMADRPCALECGLWCTSGSFENSSSSAMVGLVDCCCADKRAVLTHVWVSSLDLLVEQDGCHPKDLRRAAVLLVGW